MKNEVIFECEEKDCKCELKIEGDDLPSPVFCPVWGGKCLWSVKEVIKKCQDCKILIM